MDVNIALLAGDGIGPEIIAEATKVLDRVALRKVSTVKKIIEASAKIEISRMRTLKSSMSPIISSAPHSQIEKPKRRPLSDSRP